MIYKVKLGYNELGYYELGWNELGHYELGYNEHQVKSNKKNKLGWLQSFHWCIFPLITNRIRL